MRASTLLRIVATITAAAAQQSAYGQCGGVSYTGPTTCVSGWYCSYQNPYYSQCLPGSSSTSSSTTTTTTTLSTTTTSSTSAISTQTSSSTTSSAPSTTTSEISSYAKVSGNIFTINGEETYFAGTNTYWIAFLTNNSDIDLVMSHIAETGLKVLRVWGFNDISTAAPEGTVWFQSFITGEDPVINTGSDGLERLDYVVQSAEAHGVSLIINFVNYWDNYGGQPLYCSYYDIPANSWYNTTEVQTQYQTYIKAVVSRYITSTAIFSWELCNEPRCPGCDTSVIADWASTTAEYIKSLDPNHMVTIGDEGFGIYGGNDTNYPESDSSYPWTTGAGLNFTQLLAIPSIDFGTYHLYPSSWGETDTWAPLWITWHATAAATIGKPVIAEEYGSQTHADEEPWQTTYLDTQTAGDMFWQYGDTISTGETPNDGYAIYYGTAEFTTLVTDHAAAMNAKAV